MYALGWPRVGVNSNYQLSYVNIGTDTLVNRTVMLIKDHRAQYISAIPAESSISGDTIRWIVPHLSPRDTGGIVFTMTQPPPPALSFGDTLSWAAVIRCLNWCPSVSREFMERFVMAGKCLSSLSPNFRP